ncbi:phosphotriesterase-related protein [Streptomyces sp. NPDC093544]|uniref:phosphotriesterase family protein n=1 Tax=Streptomyces sp. NPDC093544 TaxID=3155200 RepID=UPI00344987C4
MSAVEGTVETVRGPVALSDLGPMLAHEHVVTSSVEFAKFYPELSWGGDRSEVVEDVVSRLQEIRDRGITSILDCTAYFHGRDMDFVREVNERVDIHLIMSTGIYTYDYLPYHVQFRKPTSVADDILTRMFLRDLTVGIGDSGVRAQSIKVATDTEGFTENNVRILRAAARASAETGAPITAHTHPADRQAQQLLDILADEGADLGTVVVAHSGDTDDLDYLRALMDRGAVMGDDRFGLYLPGTPSEEARMDVLATLCAEGYADRIVLSHDALLFCDWMEPGVVISDTWVPTRVSDVIVPGLRARGVSQKQLDSLLVSTPASLFAGVAS